MTEYVVQSGSLKIVLLAESAMEAAIEAVLRWGTGDVTHETHRAGFAESVTVQRSKRGVSRRFATFNVLAHARGECPSEAWRRLLARSVASPN
jgi:hypothetical protein